MIGTEANDATVMAEINLTPFTDVLLVLLIIFMLLAALVAPPGFEKKLQNAAPSAPRDRRGRERARRNLLRRASLR